MANREGKAQAITVLTPVKPGWTLWLRLLFWIAGHFQSFTAPLRQLSFIHYARWNIIKSIPYNGAPQTPEQLNYQYLLFTSNFNGTWDAYIDAFSYTVPQRMSQIWGSSYGFPGPLPVKPFKEYIRRNEFVANHYYSAYPDATTTIVLDALELRKRFAVFKEQARAMEPDEFKAAYQAFLTDVQRYI
ncbi:MAG: hypothetical protein NVSMB22_26970 [Chloroflexota bacterium]